MYPSKEPSEGFPVCRRTKSLTGAVSAAATLGIFFFGSASSLHAAPFTWDGNGSSDDNGTWETLLNWDTNILPDTEDNAQLPDVTTGARTVTISLGAPQSINQLTMTQTTLGALNVLDVNANLTLSGTGISYNPFVITPAAGEDSIVTNIGAGTTLKVSGDADYTSNFAGNLNMAENSVFRIESTTGFTANFGGLTNAATGSKLLLQYGSSSGDVKFIQTGDLTMDGARLDFDWVAAANGTIDSNSRNFQNTGNWALKNGSTVAFISSTGRSASDGWMGANNNNSGTFKVESGSEVGFQDLFNTGTMDLGSSTAGVSDALVTLGSPDNTFRSVTLTNGVTSGGTGTAGTINVNGDALLGRTMDYADATTTLNNGNATSTGSVINVGDGTMSATFTVANRDVAVNNFAGNTVNLKANGSLHLKSNAENPTGGSTTLTNDGTFVHAGSLVLQGSSSGARTVSSSATGLYQVSGTDAVLEAQPTASGSNPESVPPVAFSVNGQLSGASASDKLTYDNSTGKTANNYLGIEMVSGTITPGNGTNGSDITSIGSLVLVNVDVTLDSQSKMAFDIGGTVESGLFDEFKLTPVAAGSGATLDLGAMAILDIWTVNGFTPTEGTYQIISADSRIGAFTTLNLNGMANSGEYNVNYLSNGVEIQFVPEPSALMLLLGSTGLLAFRRRRN